MTFVGLSASIGRRCNTASACSMPKASASQNATFGMEEPSYWNCAPGWSREPEHSRRRSRWRSRPRGPVVEALLERGLQVFSINPKQLDRFRDRFSVAGAKDDSRDAYVLGCSLRTDRHAFRRLA